VQLEYGQEARDKYRRLLAFVWLSNSRMLNEALICEGYATALTRYLFRACERSARDQGKGLWGAGLGARALGASASRPTPQAGPIKGNKKSRIYHRPDCPNYHDLSPANVQPFATEHDAQQAGYR
jgi:micrococcal nuclease